MKKIITREIKHKKEKRNKIIIGLILVSLMILSTAGYAFFSGSKSETAEKKVEYNGIEFILEESGLWSFEIQNFQFLTQYNPEETENISVPIFLNINDYANKPLFFAGEDTTARQEIARTFQKFASRMQDACVVNYEELSACKEDLPIKNCSQDNIIFIKDSEFIETRQEVNCVLISAPYAEQTRVADAFLFKILGIRNF